MTRPGPGRVRVAFVVDAASLGGAEHYVALLAAHLPERFEASVVATDTTPVALLDELEARGIPVRLVPRVRHKGDLGRLAALPRVLGDLGPDLVHLNLTWPTNNRHALLTATLGRRPAVATLHLASGLRPGVQRQLLRVLFRRLRRVIAVSGEVATALRDDLSVPADRICVVANGVPVVPMQRRPPTLPVRIGGIGRLTEEKGFDLLVAATRRLVARDAPVEVVIAGEGPERDRLLAAAEGLPVELAGHVDDAGTFLATLDVFCLPSRWEGLPFALLEAMMSGLPCVASAVGDVAAAVDGAAVLVPAGDVTALDAALEGLAHDPAERARLGDAGRRRAVERLSVAAMAAATAAVYDEVLRPARRRR